MKKQYLLLIIILYIFIGCDTDNDLKESVFIFDSSNPNLPEYSEWGYNTFGAYYDRDIFISNDDLVPVKVIVKNNTMSFTFSGQKNLSDYYYNDYNEMSLTINFPGFTPKDYSELVVLNDTIFDLKNPSYVVLLSMNENDYKPTIMSGELHFKRAQYLTVDKEPVEVILSGNFELKLLIDEEPVTISDGRFDVGINKDNFYNY